MGKKIDFGDIQRANNPALPDTQAQAPAIPGQNPVAPATEQASSVKKAAGMVNELGDFLNGVNKIVNVLLHGAAPETPVLEKKAPGPQKEGRESQESEGIIEAEGYFKDEDSAPEPQDALTSLGAEAPQIVGVLNIVKMMYGDVNISQLIAIINGEVEHDEEENTEPASE